MPLRRYRPAVLLEALWQHLAEEDRHAQRAARQSARSGTQGGSSAATGSTSSSSAGGNRAQASGEGTPASWADGASDEAAALDPRHSGRRRDGRGALLGTAPAQEGKA